MKFLLSIVLLIVPVLAYAQVQKGDWLIKGEGLSINETLNGVDYSTINFKIALGYAISDQWVAGGGVGLKLTDLNTEVRHEVFGRFYFKDTLRKGRFYVEGKWTSIDISPVETAFRDQRIKLNSSILAFGVDFFLSENLALETQFNYAFFNQYKRFDRGGTKRYDSFNINVGLQYFFRYRDFREERLIDYREVLSKNTWFVGGFFEIPKRDRRFVVFIQNIRPVVGWFIARNWAIGGALRYHATTEYEEINLGLLPFTRYYLNVGRKKKVFAELKTGYLAELRYTGEKYERRNRINYGGSIGWSNFITREVSFDISYSFSRSNLFRKDFSLKLRTDTERGLKLSLQYFFSKKNL